MTAPDPTPANEVTFTDGDRRLVVTAEEVLKTINRGIQAEAEVDRLTADLAKYGDHTDKCAIKMTWFDALDGRRYPCDCGWADR